MAEMRSVARNHSTLEIELGILAVSAMHIPHTNLRPCIPGSYYALLALGPQSGTEQAC